MQARQRPSLSEAERAQFLTLAWSRQAATPKTRRCILRTVIVEIVARVDDNEIDLKIHWQGGNRTQLNVRKARSGEQRWILDAPTTDHRRVRALKIVESGVDLSVNLPACPAGAAIDRGPDSGATACGTSPIRALIATRAVLWGSRQSIEITQPARA
jgi:hypothetical protein